MKYIAILRGINVSGKKKILMQDLKLLLKSVNLSNIETYIQSGNISFEINENYKNKDIETIIEDAIKNKYNFSVPVIVRTNKELLKIINNNPFTKGKNIIEEKLYFTFLKNIPEKLNIEKLIEYNYYPDDFIFSNNVVYVYIPDKYGKTKLSNTFFENKLKVQATTRNWKTTMKLLEMSSELRSNNT